MWQSEFNSARPTTSVPLITTTQFTNGSSARIVRFSGWFLTSTHKAASRSAQLSPVTRPTTSSTSTLWPNSPIAPTSIPNSCSRRWMTRTGLSLSPQGRTEDALQHRELRRHAPRRDAHGPPNGHEGKDGVDLPFKAGGSERAEDVAASEPPGLRRVVHRADPARPGLWHLLRAALAGL